jgi:acetylornithine deacetylase
MDTVDVQEMQAPFTLRQEGDRLYGRGAYDMKGSIAIMLALVQEFHQKPPPGDVWLTFVSDEEDKSVGTEALVREWLPTLPEPPIAAIVLEPTEEQIGIAHRGFAWFEIAVEGRAAHGSMPEEGVDAIMPLGPALVELAAIERQFQERQPRHPLLGRPSLHASTIEGGSAWSVYPSHAVLRWERRTLPREDESTLQAELDRVLAATRAGGDARVRGSIPFVRAPMETGQETALIKSLQALLPGAGIVGLPFWTDGALFHSAGIPTVIFGPEGHGAHAIDEWVSLSSLERVRDSLLALVRNGLG